jgi:putative phosphoribosyl transferase
MSITETTRFKNRLHAGEMLVKLLPDYAGRKDAIALALPRGGVPVGYAVASALGIALDVLIVRKIGMPGHVEYALGAIASGGKCVLQSESINALGISPETIKEIATRELREIERRELLYRSGRLKPRLRDRVVILVDDGLATGSTMQVAVDVVRQESPSRLIIAVPVSSREAVEMLRPKVDELICLSAPESFFAVGQWYEDFEQTTDDEVRNLLEDARKQFRGDSILF